MKEPKIVKSKYIWCDTNNYWSAIAVCQHKIYARVQKECLKCFKKNKELRKLIEDSKNETR